MIVVNDPDYIIEPTVAALLEASLDRSDADHAACPRLIESADEALLIPAPVLVENEPNLATLDRRHFGIPRPRHRESIELLPA